jgi:hypothetical protein
MMPFALLVVLLLTGCAGLKDTIDALGHDEATFCGRLGITTLYGSGNHFLCRTNTKGSAKITVDPNGAITIELKAAPVP